MSDSIDYRPTRPAPSPQGGGSGPRRQLDTLLVPGETVTAFALQHRVYALIHRRNLAAATTGRFIFMTRPLLGGYTPFHIRWQDLKEASVSVGMFSAALTLTYSANLSDTAGGEGETMVLRAAGLTIETAQALYRECQAQEQSWREKRRVRTIEEMRAAAGGVQIATGVYPQQAEPPSATVTVADPPRVRGAADDNPVERLTRAKAMLDQGLITDSEYEAIKAKVVGSL